MASEHHYKALVCTSVPDPLQIQTLPTPQATPGSAIVKVLTAAVLSYTSEIYSGKRPYPYPTPFTPGSGAIGRIAALGPDATSLKIGDLILTDTFVRGRDDPDALCLQGLHQGGTPASARLVEIEWRNGTYAEFAKVPLENCTKLSENAGYKPEQLLGLVRMLVAFGGLTGDGGVDLKVGETMVIAPATGQFSGAAVEVALAMGAKVIALGRSVDGLNRLKTGLADYGNRLRTLQITGDVEVDTKAIGPVDCYLDLSPPAAADSTHLKSCILALRSKGRACLMGGILGDVSIPHMTIMRRSLQVRGKWMFERAAAKQLVQMVEAGMLRLDRQKVDVFPLEEWEKAFANAAEKSRWDELTCLRLSE